MRKRWFVILAILLLVGVLAFTLVACDPEDPAPEEQGNKVTVTFVNGDTVLRTEQVEKGSSAKVFEDYVPEIEGCDFLGWYAAPSMMIPFDFDTVVFDENTTVFAKAPSSDQPDDTRTWYLAGAFTSADLLENNYGAVLSEAATFTPVEGEKNTFEITVDLYEGDQFQLITGNTVGWLNQRGYGHIEDTTVDGVTYFTSDGGLGNPGTRRMNAKVQVDGNYTLTLKTYPANDTYDTENPEYTEEKHEVFNNSIFDYVTWERNGDPVGEVGVDNTAYDFYIKGEIVTGWAAPKDAQYKMTESDGVYTLTIALEANDNFMFYSYDPAEGADGTLFIKAENIDRENSAAEILGSPESGNMKSGAAGTYTFTYTRSTGVCVVTYTA